MLARIQYYSGLICLILLVVLLTSGWGLMGGYIPSDREAFSCLRFIEQNGGVGAFLRNLHYIGSFGAIFFGFLYLLTAFLVNQPKRQRFAWWAAVFLYLLVIMFSFTGFLLPMDQNAYWGTIVRLGIIDTIPWIGSSMGAAIRGGPLINASTLPRFYALHVSILPLVVVISLIGLGWLNWEKLRNKIHPLRFSIGAFAVVVAAYLAAVFWQAPLEPPADPNDFDYIPRPEWYFLWLFQFGKYTESIPWLQSFLLPSVGIGLLVALPFADLRPLARKIIALCWSAAWLSLTAMAVYEDRDLPRKLTYQQSLAAAAGDNYRLLCRQCHGDTGKGDGPEAVAFLYDMPDFQDPQFWMNSVRGQLAQSVREGKGSDMPAFGNTLSDDEIDVLLNWLRQQWGPQGN